MSTRTSNIHYDAFNATARVPRLGIDLRVDPVSAAADAANGYANSQVYRRHLKWLLLAGDVGIAAATVILAEAVNQPRTVGAVLVRAAVLLVATVVGLYVVEAYETALGRRRIVASPVRVAIGLFISAMVVLPCIFVVPSLGIGRAYVLTYYLAVCLALLTWRWTGAHYLHLRLPRSRVVVVGGGGAGEELIEAIDKSHSFVVSAVLDDDPSLKGTQRAGHTIAGSSDQLASFIGKGKGELVAVAISGPKREELLNRLVVLRYAGLPVLDMASAFETITQRLPVSHLNAGWVAFSSRFDAALPGWQSRLKRLTDIIVSVAGLVLFGPVMALVALAILIMSGRPVFYRQERVGFHGRRFHLVKFRSMRVDSESGKAQWAQQNDARATPIGGFLRKTHLDELPQFWNVLRGHMSIVGPRPERPEFVEMLRDVVPYYDLRHMTKPGITGWAQVRYPYGASIKDAVRKLEYDLYYIRHCSFTWDMRIILRTAIVALTSRGSR